VQPDLPDLKVIQVHLDQRVTLARLVLQELEVQDLKVTPVHKGLPDLKVMLVLLGQ
jgi:hypothetical protein